MTKASTITPNMKNKQISDNRCYCSCC